MDAIEIAVLPQGLVTVIADIRGLVRAQDPEVGREVRAENVNRTYNLPCIPEND